ncbi:Gfo/Idh/MocA family oxidoreductase [Halarchaeum sp. CBA1220]|uniref:Gfo/Idh/MocA family protein n=1 Tax=Halarchaeum sp. CBA1220 TaxID=1853682 RepID=UPI000F3AA5C2|nr:Gfo/Idh/MocA family oxidoreductase [Halarchaeum sp. CBA1220]QLC34184.1 Gfo/Idh/MocA family oxidoreductase [Halarchaeum sp. CBA1220]
MRFGVISTADIALKSFLPGVARTDHDVVAIASRDAERAAAVAADHGIPESYGSYDVLLDADIDAVYNPLPNGLHAEWTTRAADAGLDVLCEKPLASDAAEARAVADHCRDAGVTLMEAFMYRYHPRTERVRDLLAEMGDVVSAEATFGFPLYGAPEDVRLDPGLAGGSLMDVGCYPVHALRTFLGDPEAVTASTYDSRDCGVDTRLVGTFEYEDGARATLRSWFDAPERQQYRIETTDGWVEVPDPAFNVPSDAPAELRYAVDGREVTESFDPVDQYAREVEHFADRVAAGETPATGGESAVANMRVIDALYEAAATGERVRP